MMREWTVSSRLEVSPSMKNSRSERALSVAHFAVHMSLDFKTLSGCTASGIRQYPRMCIYVVCNGGCSHTSLGTICVSWVLSNMCKKSTSHVLIFPVVPMCDLSYWQ